tara:strand:- start:1900 stop:2193 length:294 start_codon:yes stop_codon:yes gene_type:complete
MSIAAMEMPADYKVLVHTSQNRGFTPEEIGERCAKEIISVSLNASPAIREQAFAFRAQIQSLLVSYMREAIKSDRTTVYNALKDAAHPELAQLIRRL